MSYWNGTRWLEDEPAANPPPRRRARRFIGAAAEAALVTTLVFGLIATSAFAAKGGGRGGGGGKPSGGTGTLSLVLLDSADGLANFGEQATFDVATTATDYPWVTVKCFQSGALVYQASNGIFATSLNEVFTLGPTPAWQGGAASCTADLENWDSWGKHHRVQTLASMSFDVAP